MGPPEPEVSVEAQMPDEALDQVKHPSTPKDPVEQENIGTRTATITYSISTTKTNGSRATITSSLTYAQTNAIV